MASKFKPKYDKIVETLLFIAHKCPGIDQYKTVKIIYFADKQHFEQYSRPITFDAYYALENGPVGSNAYDLLKSNQYALRRAKITSLPIRLEEIGNLILMKEPLRAVDYECFSKSDIRVLDAVIAKYACKTFGEIFDETHEHFAYQNAWINKKAGQKRASMNYVDMMEDGESKAIYIEEKLPIASHVR